MENFAQLEYVMLLLMGSIILAVGLSWISIKFAPYIGLMDIPGSAEHKNHHNPVPLVGGIVLMDTFIVMLLLTGMCDEPRIWAIIISSLIVGLVGLLDDFIHLTAIPKLLGQTFAAVILIYLGVKVQFFDSPEFLIQLDDPMSHWMNLLLTILWLVTVTNAFNFIDSMDGLAVGLSGVSSGFFLMISLVTGQTELAFLCTIILGISIALYLFNSRPASLFLGDSGAQSLGFLLAAAAIIYEPKTGSQASTWFVPILVFAIPLFDMVLVVFSRLKRGKKIHKASQDHTYHRLAQRGIPIHHAVLIMHGASLILSMVGFLCLNLPVVYANLIFALILFLGLSAFIELDQDYT
ncbi:MAG: undecaprenyl/decaprenyl-phosphate alpha-N-acetylglucosaminyl 1-phosphate transferase [Candidatus Marinimicrobia bacterium]|nr:undecaprenyl/decaprenyl-phosphate alpha-N-acetylglucosaminyl 1-phosphate transferase [Candidatus Neomarinimicrobiota bacterium]